MNDIANLNIRVQSLEAEVADRRLNKLQQSGGKAERATDGLTDSFKRLIGPLAASVGVVSTLTKVISVTREFEVLNAQLITATGSAESAGVAFEAIQDFASSTPYDLQQVTDGFTKLVNLGLTPSEKALTAYGDTASAMGKDLNQLIEAVADAATGEFERLKEFGVKASTQGDQVAFTFRGVTTTVAKEASAIEDYLIQLGENNFAGAMAQRMMTLDGALSNLGDEWDMLWLNISNQGVGDVIEDSVRLAIDILTELNAMLASGEMQAYIDAIIGKFEGFGDDVVATLEILTAVWNDFLGTPEGEGIAGATGETVKFLIAAFKNLPENIRAVVQLMAVEIAALVDYGQAYGEAFAIVLGSEFAKLVEKSKAYGKAIGQAINPFDDNSFDLEAKLRELDAVAADMADNAFSRAEKQAEITTQARRDSIASILEEREAALNSFDTQISKAEELRQKYDEAQAARAAGSGDRLEQFAFDAGDALSATEQKRLAKEQEEREKAFAKLEKDLRTEEEVIQESYNRRLAIILQNTEEGSAKQAELRERLNEQFATDVLGDWAEPDTHEEELQAIEDFWDARRKLVLENTELTEEERTELEAKLTKERNERIEKLEATRRAISLRNASNLFGELANLSKEFAGEQSGIYKAMFAVSKAFSIAESVIAIQTGIAQAAAQPFPANLAAMGSVVSATAGILSTIKGTEIEAVAHGGMDYVPEEATYLVNKGERILSPKQNKDFTNFMQENKTGGGGKVIKLEVINRVSGEPTVATGEMVSEDHIRVFIDAAENKLRGDLHEGRGIWREAREKYRWSTKGAIG